MNTPHHHHKTKILIVCACLASISACHHNPPSCQQLTGTWKGQYRDPSNLFTQKNQPIQLQIVEEKGVFYGYSQANDSISGHAVSGPFSGRCNQGKLSRVYLENKNHCGHFAPIGKIHENKLLLKLPYENAMTQTNFTVTAKRIDNKISAVKRKIENNINTCH